MVFFYFNLLPFAEEVNLLVPTQYKLFRKRFAYLIFSSTFVELNT